MTRPTDTGPCGWNTGTAMAGPSRCGKPSKARTNHPSTNNERVCGTHARKVRSNRHGPVGVIYALRPDEITGGCQKCGGTTVEEHRANIDAFGGGHVVVGNAWPTPADAPRVAEGR